VRKLERTSILGLIAGLLALAPFSVANAQDTADLPDADSILDRLVEVTGGADAYRALTSQIVIGTMSIPAANISGSMIIYQANGNMLTVVELAGLGTIETGVTDGVAWENSVLTGARILDGGEKDLAIRQADLGVLVDWRDHYPQVETVGIESVNGEDAYEVVMTPASGTPQSMFLSVDSGLALSTEIVVDSVMGRIPVLVMMSDYEDFGGILSPTTLIQNAAGQAIRITIDSGEFNVAIPPSRFDLPAGIEAILQ
jgi:hypothetical protein